MNDAPLLRVRCKGCGIGLALSQDVVENVWCSAPCWARHYGDVPEETK